MGLRRSYDPWLFITGFLLLLGGLFMVGSSTSYLSMRELQDPSAMVWRRGVHCAAGVLAFIIALKLPYRDLGRKSLLGLLFGGCVALLVMVFFMPAQGGAHRWIVLGPLRFQPSELAKLFAVVYVASKLARRRLPIDALRETVLPCAAVVGLLAVLILAEPDLGSAAVLVAVAAVMVFAAGLNWKYVLAGGGMGLIAVVVGVLVEPYRFQRVIDFVGWVAGRSPAPYQLDQSLIAVGSGGLTGVGFGQSTQKAFFLPASHTDFIFSIVGEERGLLGTVLVLIAFLVIFVRGIRTTRKTAEPFGAYLALGLTSLIVGQGLLHMAVCIGFLPTTGLTLPLISYGGSSVVTSMFALGLLINVSQDCNLTPSSRRTEHWPGVQRSFSWSVRN